MVNKSPEDIKKTVVIEKDKLPHMGLIRMEHPEDISVGYIPFQFTPFYQSIDKIVINRGTIEEEIFEPTFKWHSKLNCRTTNGSFFSVNLILDKEDVIDGKISLDKLHEYLVDMFETMEDYRLCGCFQDKLCDLHNFGV